MKLRTGKPIWLSYPAQPLREKKLSSSMACDVAIIGAGITGALVAHRLLLAGLRVVMIEKRRAGFGSTAASTGLLLIQPDTSIAELTRMHSRRTAQRVYQLGNQAIRDLGILTRRLKIDCGWKVRRTLYVASSPDDAALLRKEAAGTEKIGFTTQQLHADRIRERYGIDFPAALLAAGAAEVSALQLTRGVLDCAQRNPNFHLFQQTRVTSLCEDSEKATLRTERGPEIFARHAIIATGYESRQFVRTRLERLRSTYVIASKPFSPAQLRPLRCLMWETARPYFYLRTTHDHRIIFGGADEPFDTDSGRERKLKRKTRELEELFATLFPPLAFRTDYAWSGTFAETTDGLPCIGPTVPESRVFCALGYGGNGITFSQIAARLLQDACLGRPNPDAELFAFDRAVKRRSRRR